MKKIVLPFLIFSILVIIGGVYIALNRNTANTLKNVIISNITDKEATISWASTDTAESFILISQNDNFPLISQLAANKYLDSFTTPSYSHSMTIKDLTASTKYSYRIYQGLKQIYQGDFSTGKKLSSLSRKRTISGKVLQADGVTPASGVIIYFQLIDGVRKSSLSSTTTDKTGGWQVDVVGIRTLDLNNYFKTGVGSYAKAIFEAGNQGRFNIRLDLGSNSKFPSIILKSSK